MAQAATASSKQEREGSVPVALQVESILGCKWSIQLLQLIAQGYSRPSEILRVCPGLSAKVMNERWRKMIRYGIVRRTVVGDRPPIQVEYALTSFGERFTRILDEVRRLQDEVDNGTVPADTGTVNDEA